MIVLDTNHLTVLQYEGSDRRARLLARIDSATDREVATTVITAEEQMRGRLKMIQAERKTARSVAAYEAFSRALAFYAHWEVLPFDESAAAIHRGLPEPLIRRIGWMDSQIAAIVLARGALLLTENLQDFKPAPDLRVEDWMGDRSQGPDS